MGRHKFFSVARGRRIGIFSSWEECKAEVDGYKGAKFKAFSTMGEAQNFYYSNQPQPTQQGMPLLVCEFNTNSMPLKTPTVNHIVRTSWQGQPLELQAHRAPPAATNRAPAAATNRASAAAMKRESASINATVRPLIVYVDGACSGNGTASSRAGCGGYFGEGDSRNFSFALNPKERQTNNRAEMQAVIHVLRYACEDHNMTSKDASVPLQIYTDSDYCVSGMNIWMHNWRSNGFRTAKNDPVENLDLWLEMDRLMKVRGVINSNAVEKRGQSTSNKRPRQEGNSEGREDGSRTATQAVSLIYVRGHAGNRGNVAADRLAVLGAQKHRTI